MGVLAAKLWAGPKHGLSMEPAWLTTSARSRPQPQPRPRPRGLSLSLLESISPASSGAPSAAATAPASPSSAPTTPPSSPTAKEYLTRLLKYNSTRGSSRKARKRVIFKHGDVNVVQGNVAKRRRRYLQDIFTTLVDAQWRWTLLVFALNFLLSWLGFAVVWWLIMLTHGDLRPENMPDEGNDQWTPCVTGISGFASCFLFSVETQHTIGYGGRSTTEECPEAIFVMCLQSICGVMIQAFMVGIVFAKLSRPKKRTQTLLFSRHAVVAQRDGQLCLMFRVGDMRKSHIIEAHVRAQLIRRKTTREGEVLPYHQQELQVGGDGEEDKIFFIWPTTIVHKITPESPLYAMSAADMIRERFEIVVILEGVIESTGMTTQARSSYLPNEILWGHRFEPMVSFKKEQGEYEVDYSLFNKTREVDTPLCSSQALDAMFAVGNDSVCAGGWRDASGSDKFEMITHTSSGGACSCGMPSGASNPAGSGCHQARAGLVGTGLVAHGGGGPADCAAPDECSEVVVVAAAAVAAAGPAPG
ncbi:hypothetical protein ONE63_008016 [Megalurothrips usitatus]|uniref:G protein-activated inward rectifier potassium channel 3-like n=1 Tax=Megalurothrips usitatus TaxID=439358 RepID=A0AAV7XT08_9NEOP|nr:hypothetical protein ONE63_008016 [Megalurothrips usitatus]